MKNKWVRVIIELVLGVIVVYMGNAIGGILGEIITIIAEVAIIVAIVEVFRKKTPKTEVK